MVAQTAWAPMAVPWGVLAPSLSPSLTSDVSLRPLMGDEGAPALALPQFLPHRSGTRIPDPEGCGGAG